MITFYQLGNLGRLGNQLFQYAALRGLGLKNGYETKIPPPQDRRWHGQKCLLQNFNIKASLLSPEDYPTFKYSYREPNYMEFDQNFFSLPDNTDIYGFFQSIKYFEEHQKEIIEELQPNKVYLEEAREYLAYLKDQNPGYEIVSLHIRRGDNTDNTNPNQIELNNFFGNQGSEQLSHNSLYYQYFLNATNVFTNRKVKYLIFSGGKRGVEDNKDDMSWCHGSFPGREFLFSEGRTSMQDFSLIMNCDHNIISQASSFGWWAAYLNSQKNKKVVAPLKYHPDILDINYRIGFYPKEWLLV